MSLRIIILLFTVSSMLSCQQTINKEKFVQWVQNEQNWTRQIVHEGPFIFDLQYQPSEYVLLQRGGDSFSQTEREKFMEENQGLEYYTLTIGYADGKGDFIRRYAEDDHTKGSLVYYFSYPFQEHIQMLTKGEGRYPVLYHFERSMDLKSSRTFVLAFEEVEGASEQVFEINSPEISPTPVQIKIKKSKIPRLSL